MSTGSERIGICVAASAQYELGLRVALFSALERLSTPADVYIVDGGMTHPHALRDDVLAHPRGARCWVLNPQLHALEQRLAGSTWEVSRLFGSRYGVYVWLRVLLPELLLERERVIYLDADTLVRADLARLWEEADRSSPVCAVRDFYLSVFARGFPWARGEPWFDRALPYFNSGVLVLNLDLLRRRDFMGEVTSFVGAVSELPFSDQDAINAVLAGEIHELDPRWNVQEVQIARPDLCFYTREAGRVISDQALRSEARIVHFTGAKPWQPESVRRDRWSIVLHLEYLGLVRRFSGYSRRRLLRAAVTWLAGVSGRGQSAVRNRLASRFQR